MISEAKIFKTFILACSLLLAGCLRNEQKIELKELKGEVFGSYYLIKFRGDLNEQSFKQDLDGFFKEFNNEFSTYQENSVISEFNRSAKNQPMQVSKKFIEMLKLADQFHKETEGAFDPTLGPVIKAWGFGGGKKKQIPSDAELKAVMAKVGFHHIHWNEGRSKVWKDLDGVQLDINAFAPGWAADLIGKMLEERGSTNFMVDISGEILFKGTKGADQPWIGGIERPAKEYAQGVHLALKMKDLAIATSGNYRQFFDEKGERKSHIIDPRTGRSVAHNVSSASVIAESAASADAWSTAMMVLGPEGLALSEKNGIKVLLLQAKKPNMFDELVSDSMKVFIEAHRL